MKFTLLYHKGYMSQVHFDNEDNIFYGKVGGINDLITFHGKDMADIKKAFKDTLDAYLKTCEEENIVPETYRDSLIEPKIVLKGCDKVALDLLLADSGLSIEECIKKLIRIHVVGANIYHATSLPSDQEMPSNEENTNES